MESGLFLFQGQHVKPGDIISLREIVASQQGEGGKHDLKPGTPLVVTLLRTELDQPAAGAAAKRRRVQAQQALVLISGVKAGRTMAVLSAKPVPTGAQIEIKFAAGGCTVQGGGEATVRRAIRVDSAAAMASDDEAEKDDCGTAEQLNAAGKRRSAVKSGDASAMAEDGTASPCTACGGDAGSDELTHPNLPGSLLCDECHERVSRPFRRGGDDVETCCRWCGYGGELVLCDEAGCPSTFCKGCISRNIGAEELSALEKTKDNWACLRCNPSQVQSKKLVFKTPPAQARAGGPIKVNELVVYVREVTGELVDDDKEWPAGEAALVIDEDEDTHLVVQLNSGGQHSIRRTKLRRATEFVDEDAAAGQDSDKDAAAGQDSGAAATQPAQTKPKSAVEQLLDAIEQQGEVIKAQSEVLKAQSSAIKNLTEKIDGAGDSMKSLQCAPPPPALSLCLLRRTNHVPGAAGRRSSRSPRSRTTSS